MMILSLVDFIYLAALITIAYISIFHIILIFEKDYPIRKRIKKFPKVSLILPAYNEEKTISKTLKNLLNLKYPKDKLEIIVVDDGSKDKTFEIAKKFEPKIKVYRKENGGKASALNYGIKKAKNEFIAVLDADSFPTKNSLINCIKCFDSEDVAAVTSRILVKEKKSIWQKWQDIEFKIIAWVRKLKEKLNLIDVTPGPLSVYRKSIIEKIGYFDEKNLVEDIEIAWRILSKGYKIKMAYNSIVYSPYPSNFKKWLGQRLRWGVGGLQIISKYWKQLFRNYPVGNFLLPQMILGYALQVLGIFILLYLSSFFILNYSELIIKSLLIGTKIRLSLSYYVDMFTFYGILMLIFSIFFLIYGTKDYKSKNNVLTYLTFLLFYIFIFPFVTSYSIIKFLKREFKWYTK